MTKITDGLYRRALLIDDHPLLVEIVAEVLLGAQVVSIITKAYSLGEAIKALSVDPGYSFAITDLTMSDAKGIEAVIILREQFPAVPLVVFSADDRVETIMAAFEAGIRGYITKDSPADVLINALTLIMAGGSFMPPRVKNVLAYVETLPITEFNVTTNPECFLTTLTLRQKQVFELLLLGVPNKVIAARLDMAEGTVKTHLNMVYRMIGVNSRSQAILKASILGLLRPEILKTEVGLVNRGGGLQLTYSAVR